MSPKWARRATGAPVSVVVDRRPPTPPAAVAVGHLMFGAAAMAASLDGRPLPLRRKEFDLLALMARHPGRVLTRERIAREVWDGDAPGRTIDIHVARLRASLPPGAIETVVKIGYRFSLT